MRNLLVLIAVLSFPMVASADKHERHSYSRRASRATSVPELDPNAAGAAVVLLIGGFLVLAGRRRLSE